MGCDIHYFVEKKTDGKWKVVEDAVEIYRYYDFFALLAGVRNKIGIEPICNNIHVRSISFPEDLDELTKKYFEYYDDDDTYFLHTLGCLTLKEIKKYKVNSKMDDDLKDYFQEFKNKLSALDDNPENVRIIFGFDN